MKNNQQDPQFMIHGSIMRVILAISAPLMFNNLVRTLYTLIDGLYVAQLSAEDFAATAFTWPINFLFISIGMGIGVAATALISRYLGGNQIDRAKNYTQNVFTLINLSGFVLALIGYFLSPMMIGWMGAEGDFFDKAVVYLQISFVGLFFDFNFFGYQAVLNAQGSTRIITKLSVISMLVNIVLDPLFIFNHMAWANLPGLGWGVAGAAIATVISKVVLSVLAARAVHQNQSLSLSFAKWQFDRPIWEHIIRVAVPSSMGYSGAALGFTIMNSVIQGYGTNTLAAFSMVNRISDLLMQPQLGVGMALTSIIGQNLGAGNFPRVREIFKQATIFILCTSLIASVIMLVYKMPILGIFIKENADPDLWYQAKEYLDYTAFIIFFMGLFSALNGMFQGMSQTKYSMIMSIGRLWILRIPMVICFSQWTNLGSTGIWISMLLSNMLIVVYGYVVYLRKPWEKILNLSVS